MLIWSICTQVSPIPTYTPLLVYHKHLSLCYLKLCTHKGQTGVHLTVFCVHCVLMCMAPFTLCTKWLRDTEYPRGIYALNHTVQHRNTKGNRKGGRGSSRSTSHQQTDNIAWKLAPWQTLVATGPSWQKALERNKLQNRCPSKLSQLVTLVKQL